MLGKIDNVLKELDGAYLIDLNKVWHQAKDVMQPRIYGGNHADLLCVHQFKPTSHPHLTHEENCHEFEEYLKASPNDWWCRTGDLLKKEHRELYWLGVLGNLNDLGGAIAVLSIALGFWFFLCSEDDLEPSTFMKKVLCLLLC